MRLYLLIIFLFAHCISFRAQEFDPLHPDQELLRQLIVEKINKKRALRHMEALEFNEALDEVALYYTNAFVLRKFENVEENKTRINKKLKKLLVSKGFHPKLTTYCINTSVAINYRRQDYYYDADEPKSSLHLYLGKKKPTKKIKAEEDYEAKPIPSFTYEELAESIVKKILSDSRRLKSGNNAYTMVGFSCVIEPKSIGGRKIPTLKYIFLLGGKIISW